jgi:2-polyprenyl-6-methoxyphenol hydroxylase-like FAD-dependent oxidoreductase
LVVFGDALCHLNPLYGQGMTMSALQALALQDCLRAGDPISHGASTVPLPPTSGRCGR